MLVPSSSEHAISTRDIEAFVHWLVRCSPNEMLKQSFKTNRLEDSFEDKPSSHLFTSSFAVSLHETKKKFRTCQLKDSFEYPIKRGYSMYKTKSTREAQLEGLVGIQPN